MHPQRMLEETIEFYGHPAIRALHRTTIEITRDTDLTLSGDCIVGVRASKGCSQIGDDLRSKMMSQSEVNISLEVGRRFFLMKAFGSADLTLSDDNDIVIRKSTFSSPRTLAVRSDRAAYDLPREMAQDLRDPTCKGKLRITLI